jgi:dipeptidyl aminopeptidase/acylaminoacyl peptidase
MQDANHLPRFQYLHGFADFTQEYANDSGLTNAIAGWGMVCCVPNIVMNRETLDTQEVKLSIERQRRIEPEDLLRLSVITHAEISPDGTRIAYALQEAILSENRYRSAIWLVDTQSGTSRRFTSGSTQDTDPRWSPDGSMLAFVSDRSGKAQIHVIDGDGGESRQLTALPRGANGPVWSPDGSRIAFVSTEGSGIEDEERDKDGGFIRHISRKRYRFDVTGYIDDRFPHIWYVDVTTESAQQVTAGEFPDSSPVWSPDGSTIAFTSNRANEVPELSQLFTISVPDPETPAPASDAARELGTGAEVHTAPQFSPDGSTIAFIGRRRDARAGSNLDVFTVPVDGSRSGKRLTADFDRGIGLGNYSDTFDSGTPSLFWSPDGQAIRFSANAQGCVGLYETDLNGSVGQVIGGKRTATLFTQSNDGSRIGFASATFTDPGNIFVCDGDGSNEHQLTVLNGDLLGELPIEQPEHIPFRSFDDRFDVDAWLIRPSGFDPTHQYPLVQIIHGGPHSVFGHVFFFDMQQWTSYGWNVLFVNPRATQSYGEEFSSACIGDWGGADWAEQEQALDLAIERGGVDPERLAVTGLSYGGFMTNWIVGQTDRYRVGVSENSICNLVSFMFTSDIGWAWLEKEMGKEFWSNMDWYMQASPITYMPNVKTPVLLLQSETDWRCPVEQGEQFYQGLKHLGVDTEMIRFPGESHGALRSGKPESRLVRRQHTLRWFNKYL